MSSVVAYSCELRVLACLLAMTTVASAQGRLGKVREQVQGQTQAEKDAAKKKADEDKKKKQEAGSTAPSSPPPARRHGRSHHGHDWFAPTLVLTTRQYFEPPPPTPAAFHPAEPHESPPVEPSGHPTFDPSAGSPGSTSWLDPSVTPVAPAPSLAEKTLAVALGPITLPLTLAGDTWNEPHYFPRFPYENGHYGYLMAGDDRPAAAKGWACMSELSYGTNFDELTRLGGRLLLEGRSRLGIDAEANWWRETYVGGADQTWLGDVNGVLRFAQSPRLQWRAGLGVNWMSDATGSQSGFNFTYGGDLFPADPWVLSATIDWGKLGEVGLFHARTTVGLQWSGCEVFVGFDYLDIGDVQFRNGVAGMRFWF